MYQKIGFLKEAPAPNLEGSFRQEPGLRETWDILRNRRRVAMRSGLVFALAAIIVLLVIPWYYRSTVRLELDLLSADPLGSLDVPGSTAGFLGTNSDSAIGTEMNVLQAEPLMIQTINDLGLYLRPEFVGWWRARKNKSDPTRWTDRPKEREKELTRFGKLLKVESVPKSFLVDVSFDYPDAALSQQVTEHLVGLYIANRYQTRYSSAMETAHWLTQQLDGFQNTVDESQQRLADFMRKNHIVEANMAPIAAGTADSAGTPSLGAGGSLEVVKLVDLNHQLVQAESNRLVAEAKYRIGQTQDPEAMSSLVQDQILSNARAQLATLQVQLAEAQATLGPHHPHTVELQNEIAQAQAQVQGRLDKIKISFKNDYDSAVQNENLLRAQTEQSNRQASDSASKYLQYQILKAEVASNAALYQSLEQKLQSAGITASLHSTHINIVNPALVPYKHHFPYLPLFLPAIAVASILFGALAALVWNRFDDSVCFPSDLDARIPIPFLCSIPHYEKERMPGATATASLRNAVVLDAPLSEAAEAYRSLRSSLLPSSPGKARVILVTSALEAEGKSTTSVNLAASLAQRGVRVMLVDGDLRKPVLHEWLNGSSSEGLSNAIAALDGHPGKTTLPATIASGFALLSAGNKSGISGDILESTGAESIFLQMRDAYDFVIVDSPPLLAANDALILGRYADTVLLVARARKTPIGALQAAASLLQEHGLPAKGIVLTDLNVSRPELRYLSQQYAFRNGAA